MKYLPQRTYSIQQTFTVGIPTKICNVNYLREIFSTKICQYMVLHVECYPFLQLQLVSFIVQYRTLFPLSNLPVNACQGFTQAWHDTVYA